MNAAPRGSGGQDGHAEPVSHRSQALYHIPECDTNEELAEIVRELCEEIFEEQLQGWYTDTSTWPHNRSFDVFFPWFNYQHHSMLVDLCEEPLIHD
jgi:hypothetical protein